MTRKSRSSGPSTAVRYVLVCAALILVAVGFYLGYRMAEPPPPPDLSSLRSSNDAAVGFERRPDPVDRSATSGADSDPSTGGGKSPDSTDTPGVTDPSGLDRAAAGEVSRNAGAAGDDGMPALEMRRQPPPGTSGAPRIALVIDDLGRSVADVRRLRQLGVDLSYAVLPFEVLTSEVVSELRQSGEEVLCHLPMEAKGGANPGPGALRLSMSGPELAAATRSAIDAVSGAVGVNNHMGSAIAADRAAMGEILSVVAERGLFFLDSRTAADTVGYSLARSRGLPAAERQVFLDPRRERDFIRQQFHVLLRAARSRGGAIGIAHPYDMTLDILAEEVPKARREGYSFVTVSQLMTPASGSQGAPGGAPAGAPLPDPAKPGERGAKAN